MPIFLILIFLLLYKISYSIEIITNFPLPKNNILEVYNKTKNKELILDLLKRTGDFEALYFDGEKLNLIRKPYLKKVVITGNYSFWKKEIKAVSGLVEGFPIDVSSIQNIPVRLKQFYMNKGYPYAWVEVHFHIDKDGNGVLYLNIDEGDFYKIDKVNLFTQKKIDKNLKEKILNILDLKGEDFSLNKIQERIDKLEEFFYRINHFDALVNIQSIRGENGKITLNLIVDPGFKYIIKFEGNRFLPESTLKKQLTFYTEGVNFYQIGVSVENMEKLYKDQGFLDIDIHPQFFEDVENEQSLIKFVINEGERYLIEDIDIETDIPELSEKISSYIGSPFKESQIRNFLYKTLERYYLNGFLDYTLNLDKIINKEDKTVYLQITVKRGKPFYLKNLVITGLNNNVYDVKLPKPYNPEEVIFLMDSIRENLKEKGYFDVNVELDSDIIEKEDHFDVKATITVKKGTQYQNKGVFIYGTKHLNISPIRKNTDSSGGFTIEEFNNELDFLYRTYLFSAITPYYTSDKKDKSVTKAFILREEKRGLFQGIIGYNTDQKFKLATSVILKNLLNYGFETSAYFEKSNIRTNYSVSFGNRILPKKTSAFITFLKSYQYHRIYNLDEEGFQIKVTKRNNKWVNNSLFLERKYNKVTDTPVRVFKNYNTFKLGYRLTDDHREPRQNPNKGYFFNFSMSKDFLDVEHFRTITSLRYYLTLLNLTFSQRVNFGYIFLQLRKLPVSERFFLGGLGDFRGFAYEEVSGINKTGGKSFILVNNDIRFPIFKPVNLYGFIFYDLGNVYEDDSELRKLYLRKTAGVGIYIPTPVGSFIFDFAYKLDKKAGEYPYRIEFSIAVHF
ncbi:BamA/TamA family outer membrane protein [Persephonella sp.]